MILAHYTSPIHVPAILEDGYLRATESNVSMLVPQAGPDVVWLTTDLDAPLSDKDGMVHGTYALKRQVQFLVDLSPKIAIKWTEWEWYHRMDPEWRSITIATGGGPEVADTWYVVPIDIRRKFWVSATDRATGEGLLNA